MDFWEFVRTEQSFGSCVPNSLKILLMAGRKEVSIGNNSVGNKLTSRNVTEGRVVGKESLLDKYANDDIG